MDHIISLADITAQLDGILLGNPSDTIQGLASLGTAKKKHLSFYEPSWSLNLLDSTQAGAVLMSSKYATNYSGNVILVSHPRQSYSALVSLFSSEEAYASSEQIHCSAQIEATAHLGKQCTVGAHSTIAKEARLGFEVHIGRCCTIGAGVHIGDKSIIGDNVTIHSGVKLGAQCHIESGCVLGARPFNSLKQKGAWQNCQSLGGLIIGSFVVVGANATISRGALGDTFIAENVQIDNLVHIAHDVTIGAHTAIAGCAAIGAFAQIGQHCIIGGASCINANVILSDDIVITGMSTVNKSIKKAGIYSSGTLVSEHQLWRRNASRFKHLDHYAQRLLRLEKQRIEEIE